MLAGTSAQSSNGNIPSGSGVVQQRDSDADGQNGQSCSAANAQDQAPAKAGPAADPAQTDVAQVASRSNAAQAVVTQPQVRSNANGTSRTTEREEKTPANVAAPVVNVALPAPVAPVQIVPVAAPPVPSPNLSAQNDNNAGAQKSEAVSGVAETQADDSRAARTARAADNGQDAPAPQDDKTDDKTVGTSSDAAKDAAVQSSNLLSGSTVCATGFSLPAGITPVALPVSSATLSAMDFLPGIGNTGQLTANSGQSSKTADTSLSKPATANAPAAAATNQAASSATPANASARNTQSTAQSSPTAQHAQVQAVQAAPAPQGQANSAVPQIQVAAHGTTQDVVPSHGRAAEGTAETTHASEQPAQADASESTASQGINTANVIQKMSETEMRVGMHSAEFGDISIRTSVSQQQMTAQISVDHGDLGKAISAHIPAMEAKLGGEFGIRALVQVSQSGMSFSGERSYSAQSDRGSSAQPAQTQVEGIQAISETDSAVPQVAALAVEGYRLDIRA